ncbi:MAG: pyridoxal-phosphate dependent enzyme [Roseiarcus sp.]
MTEADASPRFVCHGCGATVDMARRLPFACPNAAAAQDDADHVLVAAADGQGLSVGREANPFLRYRQWLTPYRLARAAGLGDDAWAELVGELDAALLAVDGRGFRLTPMTRQPALAEALGLDHDLWVKDETGNVSGSHKGRHLMGVMLYLRVLERARLPAGEGLRARRLTIASCGNAALAAATIARAAKWPLDVFIPADAESEVVRRLGDLGAAVGVSERRAGEAGDPCVRDFRRAVASGAIPFGVQGPDNGLAVEGARTLAFEMAEQLGAEGAAVDAMFVQVGGGALASALGQGFAMAVAAGLHRRRPRLVAVQTASCAPLARAWRRLAGVGLDAAARRRSSFMWPWESVPSSLAHGILDDETYDWWEVAKAMRETDGDAVVADEDAVGPAHRLARAHTGINVSATGAAGLAGALSAAKPEESLAVVFSGVERQAGG